MNGGAGLIVPLDRDDESTMMFTNLHLSYALTPRIFPLIELNHFGVLQEGDRKELVASIAEFEGGDLINLGSDIWPSGKILHG